MPWLGFPLANEMNSRVNHFMPSNSQLLDGQISRVGWSLRGGLFLLSSEVRHNSSRALNNNEARVNRFNLWDNSTIASITIVGISLPLANNNNSLDRMGTISNCRISSLLSISKVRGDSKASSNKTSVHSGNSGGQAAISVVSICLPLANEVDGGVNHLLPSDSQFLDGYIGGVSWSFRGLLLLLSSEVWDHSSRAWNHNISRVDRLNLWNYSSIASIT